MSQETLTQVQSAAQDVSQAQQRATQLAAQSSTLPTELRKAVTERFQENPLFGRRETAVEQAIAAGPEARARIAEQVQAGTIFSPSQQLAIEEAQRGAAVAPLTTLNQLIQQQTQGIEGAITAGVNAFNSLVTAAQGDAQLAQQKYNNLFQL